MIAKPNYNKFKIFLSAWPSLRMSRRIKNSIMTHSEWAIQKSRANSSLYFVQILCFGQNSPWRIFIKELNYLHENLKRVWGNGIPKI